MCEDELSEESGDDTSEDENAAMGDISVVIGLSLVIFIEMLFLGDTTATDFSARVISHRQGYRHRTICC